VLIGWSGTMDQQTTSPLDVGSAPRILAMMAAALEGTAGSALIASPSLVVHLIEYKAGGSSYGESDMA
jgi:hypothetical protein